MKKLAGAFAHKRYRSVCSDLTAKQRRKLGGTKSCMVKVELLNSSASIKRFTLVKARLNKSRTRATIKVRINGSSKHVLKRHVPVGGAEVPPRPRVRRLARSRALELVGVPWRA